jgi:GntR family transcriptional regulator
MTPDPIVARFHSQNTGLPKHVRVRAAIVDAVNAGELPVGTKVKGERELTKLLGISLGTTQKALSRLMVEGFLTRRQGGGTFVGSTRSPVSRSWHFRFLADDGQSELPIFVSIVERRLISEAGPWLEALGHDPKGYVCLRRQIDVSGKFTCGSRIYLPASRFGRLMRMAEKRLNDVNLKAVLQAEFSAPTLTSDGIAHLVQIEPEDAGLAGVDPQSWGLQLDITGRTFGRVPITFQRIVIPPTGHGLKLDFVPPT